MFAVPDDVLAVVVMLTDVPESDLEVMLMLEAAVVVFDEAVLVGLPVVAEIVVSVAAVLVLVVPDTVVRVAVSEVTLTVLEVFVEVHQGGSHSVMLQHASCASPSA